LVIDADDDTARRIEANLYKLVNVLLVEDVTFLPTVARELALIKVRASAETRPRVLQVCEVFGARVVDLTAQLVTVELTATPDKIDDLVGVLAADGVVEMVRTGVVAMARGERPALPEPRLAALATRAHEPRELDSHESQGAA
jgi:acetolactate synthase-1/3 small subunit